MTTIGFLSGLLMGLASSLHCAGMCGGIASTLLIGFGSAAPTRRTMLTATLLTQAGRICAYVGAGGLLGATGTAFLTAFDHATAYAAMRWTAGLALAWIGLSIAGLLPSLSGLDRLAGPVTRWLVPARALGLVGPRFGPFLSGLAWGFLPCGLVYGALVYAMLAGDGLGGGLVMLGFGLGTLPSVVLTALGIGGLRRIGMTPRARLPLGLAIACLSLSSLALTASRSGILCLPG